MNRETLFRGKRIDNGEWVEGDICRSAQQIYIHPNHNSFRVTKAGLSKLLVMHEINPDTIGQYTGLTDKNGRKIFEGDILRFGKRHLLVWWNCEAFQWQAKTVAGYDLIPFEIQGDGYWTNIDLGWIYSEIPTLGKMTTEVIGNIRDNPELLEGK